MSWGQGNIFCVVRNRKQGPTFTVTVKVLSGQSFDLSVAATDTIQEVKAQIEKSVTIPVEKQRLVFAGKLLCDTATVSESRIEDGNTLHLVVRLTVQGEAGSTMESQGTVCALRGTCDSPGACGLLNLGNTCYLNSTLQALSNTVALRRYYEAGHYKADISCTPDSMGGRLADGFANLLRSIWGNEFRIVKPHEVRSLISEKWSQFAGCRQHDAQELLMFLLDGLHEDVKRSPSPCPRGSESASSQCHASDSQDAGNCQTDSKIKDIFHFQVRSTTTFCDVGMRSEKFEPMVYLTLPIPGPEDTALAERSLEDCLDSFSKQEELCQDDWVWCDQTQQRERSLKKIELWTAPECLIIHLKRFVADSSSIDKDGSFVRFPFELDLSRWLAGPPTEGEQYKLYAVVNHSGSLSYGHYTAYCKVGEGSDKKWYFFNDARVTQASESDVVSPEAYLLFYERF
ncbi:Usp8 [Symbiodinium microadriaticum]|nr:Usp8 [Symbiodinium microadriaticum]CAE7305806.1 Usp8 [Symbiodinium sp. KB8]